MAYYNIIKVLAVFMNVQDPIVIVTVRIVTVHITYITNTEA